MMNELTDFEMEIARRVWAFCDVNALMEDEELRTMAKNEAKAILELAKKELLKDAVEAEAREDYLLPDGEAFGYIMSRELSLDFYGLKDDQKVKLIIIPQDDESSKN